jgi:hypothetical protein
MNRSITPASPVEPSGDMVNMTPNEKLDYLGSISSKTLNLVEALGVAHESLGTRVRRLEDESKEQKDILRKLTDLSLENAKRLQDHAKALQEHGDQIASARTQANEAKVASSEAQVNNETFQKAVTQAFDNSSKGLDERIEVKLQSMQQAIVGAADERDRKRRTSVALRVVVQLLIVLGVAGQLLLQILKQH